MAYGTVYVFNIYSQKIVKFMVNGQGSAGAIAPPSKDGNRPYTPKSIGVGRTNLNLSQLNSPLFVTGINTITIDYEGDTGTLKLNIPAPPGLPLEYDLWLYIAYKQANLYEQSGLYVPNPQDVKGSFPVMF